MSQTVTTLCLIPAAALQNWTNLAVCLYVQTLVRTVLRLSKFVLRILSKGEPEINRRDIILSVDSLRRNKLVLIIDLNFHPN